MTNNGRHQLSHIILDTIDQCHSHDIRVFKTGIQRRHQPTKSLLIPVKLKRTVSLHQTRKIRGAFEGGGMQLPDQCSVLLVHTTL